ncbi:unnamed protein product, partial [Polarella glacialis]
KTLAQWLTAAAQRASSGSLSSEAMRLLKEMPGMPSFLDEADAINSLVSWVEAHNRLPSNAPEIIEQGQYRGLRELRAAFLKYTLTADDMRRIRRAPELYHYITQPKSATSWRDSLADVISWIEENEQLPSGRSGDELEQLQYRRIQQLRWYYFGGLLSSEDMQTLRDTPEIYDLTRAWDSETPVDEKAWRSQLQDVVDWLRQNHHLSASLPYTLSSCIQNIRLCYLGGLLAEEDMQMLRATPELSRLTGIWETEGRVTVKSWRLVLSDLIDWIQVNQRYPGRDAQDKYEHLQRTRLQFIQSRYVGGLLSEEDKQMLKDIPEFQELTGSWDSGSQTTTHTPWRKGLRDVVAWIKDNQRLPARNAQDKREDLQGGRIQSLQLLYLSGRLSSQDKQMLRDTPELKEITQLWDVDSRMKVKSLSSRLSDVAAWIQDNQRHPSQRSANRAEKICRNRVVRLRSSYVGGHFSEQELQMLRNYPELRNLTQLWDSSRSGNNSSNNSNNENSKSMSCSWLSEVIGWVREKQRLPARNASDKHESSLVRRIQTLRSKYLSCDLTEDDEQMLSESPEFRNLLQKWDSDFNQKPRMRNSALSDLVAWMQSKQRLPMRNPEDKSEDEQARRLAYVKGRYVKRLLSSGDMQMFQDTPQLSDLAEEWDSGIRSVTWGGVQFGSSSEDAPSTATATTTATTITTTRTTSTKTETNPEFSDTVQSWDAGKSSRWVLKLRNLIAWVESQPRLPSRKSADTNERTLALSLTALRRAYVDKKLSESETQMLRDCPGLSDLLQTWDAGASSTLTAFHVKITSVITWVQENHRLPRRDLEDRRERSQASTINALRLAYLRKELSELEIQMLRNSPALSDLLQTWAVKASPAATAFHTKVSCITAWVQENRRLPGRDSADRLERKWANAINTVRLAYVGSQLVEDDRQMLRGIPEFRELIERWDLAVKQSASTSKPRPG